MNEISPILQFIQHYGYWIAIPIMIIEGPVITVIMGFLSSLGVFNLSTVIGLGVIADLISDTFYYWSGRHGGELVLKKLKIPHHFSPQKDIENLKAKFEAHPKKIIFFSKILPGVTNTTYVLAGVARLGYRKVMQIGVFGGLIWTTGLALFGYYFGRHAINLERIIVKIGAMVFVLILCYMFYRFWLKKYIARKAAVWRENGNED